jgi:hypothetical protein
MKKVIFKVGEGVKETDENIIISVKLDYKKMKIFLSKPLSKDYREIIQKFTIEELVNMFVEIYGVDSLLRFPA